MRYALSVLLAAHGIAHLVGFMVPWRFLSSPDMPFKTTLLAGRVDVGDAGIRVVGVLWLLTALVIIGSAAGLALHARWAESIVLPVVLVSLVLCLIEVPQAGIGLALNVGLVLLLLLHPTVGTGVMRWQRQSEDDRVRLVDSGHGPTGTFTPASVASLPAPAARYFRHVLTDGQPVVTTASFTQDGQFRLGESESTWSRMTATQHFSVREPGFVWDARISAIPLLPVFVRDSYILGTAGMTASLLGLYSVMDAQPSADLNAGALQRYLAEAVWFPTALLPASGVAWDSVDDRSARATLTDHGTTVSLDFRFTDAGDIDRASAAARQREVKGAYIPTPWIVTCRDHAVVNGMRIPTYCEVSWEIDGKPWTYWKGRVSTAGVSGP